MLQRIIIRNYAIIDEVDIHFSSGLNIITGETGAGKSIILGALGLIKGERAQTQMIRDPQKKCIIEAQFDFSKSEIQNWFSHHQIEYKQISTIRRELTGDGKTKAFINDTLCNVSILQDLGNQLVEIHSQHDSMEIKSTEFQLQVVDAFADNSEKLIAIKSIYTNYKSMLRELSNMKESQTKSQAEKDLQTYQLKELSQYDFEEWDLEKIESEYSLMENSLEIKQMLGASISHLKNDEVCLLDGLKEILSRMRKFEKYSKELVEINEELEISIDKITEVSRDYEHLSENIDFDEEKLMELREKVDFINKMLKKHGITSIIELSNFKSELSKTLSWGENLTEKIAELELEVQNTYQDYLRKAHEISERRKAIIPTIESKLLANLSELQMENSQFQIEINTNEENISDKGLDTVEFLFTANSGSPLRELKRAISGGEMSRFMLSIKSLIAEKINLPTIIFDEIDTGVSGLVANKVAAVLEKLSKSHQIVAITHLPQIASRGFHHFSVYKSTENQITSTNIKLLHQADREIEIAHMISGEQITQASLTSARELLT